MSGREKNRATYQSNDIIVLEAERMDFPQSGQIGSRERIEESF
jgi:hypothetical protein